MILCLNFSISEVLKYLLRYTENDNNFKDNCVIFKSTPVHKTHQRKLKNTSKHCTYFKLDLFPPQE
jgi:hypothetical protein